MLQFAWLNVFRRRVPTLVLVTALLAPAGLALGLLVIVRDLPSNIAALYNRDEWRQTVLVDSTISRDGPFDARTLETVKTSVPPQAIWASRIADGSLPDGRQVQLASLPPSAIYPLVTGRIPASGACEAVTASNSGTAVGDVVTVRNLQPNGGDVRATVVGLVEPSSPFFNGDVLALTCGWESISLSDAAIPKLSGVWVDLGEGAKPQWATGYTTLQSLADQALSGRATTGVLGLIACFVLAVLAILGLVLGRSTTRARAREFSVRRTVGESAGNVARQTMLEALMVTALVAVVTIPIGIVLARWIASSGNPAALAPGAPWSLTRPSMTSIAIVVSGLLALVISTYLTSVQLGRRPILTALRRAIDA